VKLRVGNIPVDAAINQSTNKVFVANYCASSTGCTLGSTGSVSVIDGTPPTALQFVPITPCRLVDTRHTGEPVLAGTSESFPVPRLGNCHIPASAGAYSLNVTMVPPSGKTVGFLTIYPTGAAVPNSSIMNSWDGRFKANAAIVPAGTNGAVSVYSSDLTDVVLDINGYFTTPDQSTMAFYPLAPCRVADTRWPSGNLGGPYLPGYQQRDLPILQSHCGIPNTAQAYSFNFTLVPRRGPMWVFSAWPAGHSQPVSSTLNAPTGTVVANAAIVPAGSNGDIDVWASNDADMVIDVNGYFAPAEPGALSLYTVVPCRPFDSRNLGNKQPFVGAYPHPPNIALSTCGISTASRAFVLNATAVPAGRPLGFLTLWPDGGSMPNASTLNAWDAAVTSNMAIVPSSNGSIDAYASGLTHLILDISGYFAP
jgi:hypothetical protein